MAAASKHLLGDPLRNRMLGHVEVKDSSPPKAQDWIDVALTGAATIEQLLAAASVLNNDEELDDVVRDEE